MFITTQTIINHSDTHGTPMPHYAVRESKIITMNLRKDSYRANIN